MFGEVAELYERHRPAYPEPLVDDLVALAGLDGTQAVLEIGAGTGKATRMFAARGIPVIAVEPSPEMAKIARDACQPYGNVVIEESDFERWETQGRRFPLLFSAQAWHWVEPTAGLAKALLSLSDGGLLAAFWNRIAWDRMAIRQALLDAYLHAAPDLANDGAMHPGYTSEDENELDREWHDEVGRVEGFTAGELRVYDREWTCSTSDYIGLLGTTSDVRLLPEAQRSALFTAVEDVIQANGGAMVLALVTLLCLAQRTEPNHGH